MSFQGNLKSSVRHVVSTLGGRLGLGLLGLAAAAAPASAATSASPPAAVLPAPASFGPLPIANGPDPSADAYLEVSPDDLGGFGLGLFLGEDAYNPVGALPLSNPTFTSFFYLFVPARNQRESITSSPFYNDASLAHTVLIPNAASDTNGDGVNDSLTSSFRVQGGGGVTNLLFGLEQRVEQPTPCVARFVQLYTIRNDATTPVSLDLVRNYDGDLGWTGGLSDDEVGTTMHGAGLGTFAFEQEPTFPGVTAITLSGPAGLPYYAGKQGVTPSNGPPPYGFGTDSLPWNTFGIPATWVNHIAGVGYDTNGLSGPAPPGGTINDAFVGLSYHLDLESGAIGTVRIEHTYGSAVPLPASSGGEGGGEGGGGRENKVTICHIPPGNPENAHYITVGASAIPAHLRHGDRFCPCP